MQGPFPPRLVDYTFTMNSVDPETHQDTESCPDDQQLRFRVPLCARVEWI
jgi:hypothetical protein